MSNQKRNIACRRPYTCIVVFISRASFLCCRQFKIPILVPPLKSLQQNLVCDYDQITTVELRNSSISSMDQLNNPLLGSDRLPVDDESDAIDVLAVDRNVPSRIPRSTTSNHNGSRCIGDELIGVPMTTVRADSTAIDADRHFSDPDEIYRRGSLISPDDPEGMPLPPDGSMLDENDDNIDSYSTAAGQSLQLDADGESDATSWPNCVCENIAGSDSDNGIEIRSNGTETIRISDFSVEGSDAVNSSDTPSSSFGYAFADIGYRDQYEMSELLLGTAASQPEWCDCETDRSDSETDFTHHLDTAADQDQPDVEDFEQQLGTSRARPSSLAAVDPCNGIASLANGEILDGSQVSWPTEKEEDAENAELGELDEYEYEYVGGRQSSIPIGIADYCGTSSNEEMNRIATHSTTDDADSIHSSLSYCTAAAAAAAAAANVSLNITDAYLVSAPATGLPIS